jgi:hypothetical protein
MEKFLQTLIGHKIDILCGANSSLRGDVAKVEAGILHLQDEDGELCYLAIEKIIAVWEKHDKERHSGFLSKS